MTKIKMWTKKEDEELLSFIEEGREKGIQVRTLCEEFASKYSDLTREQVRSHYYQLTNNSYRKKEYKKGSWSIKEDRFLLESIDRTIINFSSFCFNTAPNLFLEFFELFTAFHISSLKAQYFLYLYLYLNKDNLFFQINFYIYKTSLF